MGGSESERQKRREGQRKGEGWRDQWREREGGEDKERENLSE